VSLVHACFNLLLVPTQVRSVLAFDLTLGVIPSDLVATSCSPHLYMLYSVLLTSCKLIGSKTDYLGSSSTFLQHINLLTEHIWA
jgi:hypothetical protein